MIFTNTIKLTLANFGISWRLVLYKAIAVIIALALGVALVFPAIEPINAALETDGIYDKLAQLWRNEANKSVVVLITEFYNYVLWPLLEVIYAYTEGFWIRVAGLILLISLLYFLLNLSDLSVTDSVNGYMSSLTSYSFTGGFIRTLNKSARYSGVKTLFTLPYDFIVVAIAFLILGAVNTWAGGLIPFLTVIFLCVAISLRITLLSLFAPTLLFGKDKSNGQASGQSASGQGGSTQGGESTSGLGAFKESKSESDGEVLGSIATTQELKQESADATSALEVVASSFVTLFSSRARNLFFRIWFAAFNMMIVLFFINYMGTFFMGLGLIITIPATLLMLHVFNLVIYYTIYQKKFYTDPNNVTTTYKVV
ncbi:MAG: hypothetical protein FWB72_01700 [Firmicutes bacterium]|nr:hypothetical protein [Bacillota bacterium]